MKVFLYWLLSLTIPLILPSLASADTIFFKDGMIVHNIGRTWRDDGQVKWYTSGITIGYPEDEVERVEKTPIEEDLIGNQPVKKIRKGIKSSKHQTRRTALQNQNRRSIILKPIAKVPRPKVKPNMKAQFSGNIKSRIFHKRGSRYYNCNDCVKKFNSREEAKKAGYRPCKICRP